jgi:hypothetical protein
MRTESLLYKLLPPSSEGLGNNDMVLGEDNVGFTTRGGILIAFSVRDGKELWRWDSRTPDIQVFAALANGGCTSSGFSHRLHPVAVTLAHVTYLLAIGKVRCDKLVQT